jgi:hypothetical protein
VKAGSWLDLDFSSLPEAEKGLQVVKEWIRGFLYTASLNNMSRMQFLTRITHIATLALFLDKDNAISYFKRSPCITTDRPHHYLRAGSHYIVHDLLDFLNYADLTALSAGVLFIK